MKNVAFVFDLDKTIGYFTQLAIFMEAIEDYIKRKLKLKEFFQLLDLYPNVFRPDIFTIFKYLKELKKKHKYVKVLIYTNNMGPKNWVHHIRKYIEYKLDYKLFDRTIAAWKVRGEIYEKCRTEHGKTVSDLISCSQLKKGDKICFLDDQKHSRMIHRNVDYLYLYPYKFDYLFKKMSTIFLKSTTLIKKDDHVKFKEHVLYFSKNNPIGYRYNEGRNPTSYDKHEISKFLKDFFKNNKKYTLTKKNKRKNKTRRKK
tara:strand:- start:74 stop:844 length:771 start_codon:yes stop_codon:yes gene_type:complete